MITSSENSDLELCNGCQKETYHQNVGEHIFEVPFYDVESILGYLTQKWDLLQCAGCGAITARVKTDYEGNYPEVEYFPQRTFRHHKRKIYIGLPDHLNEIYLETIQAYNAGAFLLCAAGLRSLLEGLCADKGITEGENKDGKIVSNLEGKINGLVKIVPEGIVKNLHSLRFLGNQALHELEKPGILDLKLAISVIEDILNIVYDLDYRAQSLFEKTSKIKIKKK